MASVSDVRAVDRKTGRAQSGWRALLREDIQTIYAKDPAARSLFEVLTCYPGLHAGWLHRIAHRPVGAQSSDPGPLVSHVNRFVTGIEIHPGARIGRRFFIDHGSGVVIGETAEIGDDVLMYQGAVLGGTSAEQVKRHPTIGDGVVIGANAVILGDIAVGDGAKVGSGSVVIESVPAEATVIGVPGRVTRINGAPGLAARGCPGPWQLARPGGRDAQVPGRPGRAVGGPGPRPDPDDTGRLGSRDSPGLHLGGAEEREEETMRTRKSRNSPGPGRQHAPGTPASCLAAGAAKYGPSWRASTRQAASRTALARPWSRLPRSRAAEAGRRHRRADQRQHRHWAGHDGGRQGLPPHSDHA